MLATLIYCYILNRNPCEILEVLTAGSFLQESRARGGGGVTGDVKSQFTCLKVSFRYFEEGGWDVTGVVNLRCPADQLRASAFGDRVY